MDIGVVSLLIQEKGFDATMAKVGALNAAGAKLGATPIALNVTAPGAAQVTQQLTTVTGVSGTAARATLVLGQTSQQTSQQQTQLAQAVAGLTNAVTANTAAMGAQAGAQVRVNSSAQNTNRTLDSMTPKVRSAANGFAALAFAVASGTPSLQSMALAGGLVATSLLEAFGPASIAVYASGIGAVVVLIGTLIGVVARLNEEAKPTQQALDHIGNIDRISTYNKELEKTDRQLTATLEKMTAWERFRSLNPLVNLGLAPTESEKEYQRLLATREALVKRGTDVVRAETKAVAAATRESAVSAAQDQLRITTAYLARAESLNSQAYALGQINLRDYFDKRQEIAEERSKATIAALAAERKALSVAPVGEKPDEAISRSARLAAVRADINAEEIARRTAQQSFMAEREAAERQLAQRIAGFEKQRLDAQGRTHAARMAAIAAEAEEFGRALAVDSTRDAATKAAMVNALRDALTLQEQFNVQERESRRIFEELAAFRDEVAFRISRNQLSEVEGERAIAAEERKRLPELQKIAAAMLAFATELKNSELIAAAQRLMGVLGQIGKDPLTFEERWFADLQKQIEDGFRRLKLTLKPQNIVLLGVDQALSQLTQQVGGLAVNVGNAIGQALSRGFSSAFTKGSGKNFAESFGNAMLQGIGDIMVQLGSAMLTYGLIMAVAAPLLAFTPFQKQALSAPAAIAAGTGLIALGAGLGAIAANNTGSRTGGGGGGGSSGAGANRSIAAQQVVLDPDRRLREAREISPKLAVNGAAKASPLLPPIQFSPVIIGTNDPKAVRDIGVMVEGAIKRNLIPSLG